MKVVRWVRVVGAVLAMMLVAGGVLAAQAVADPAGTLVVNPTPTDPPVVDILGASSAGVLYRVRNPQDWYSKTWAKPAGAAAFRVDDGYQALVGSTLFGRSNDLTRIWYRTLSSSTTRTCPTPSVWVQYVPGGWVLKDAQDLYTLVTAEGCVERNLATYANSWLLAADADGFVILRPWSGGGDRELLYVPFADPVHPKLVHSGSPTYGAVSVSHGVVAWAEGSTVFRWSTTGGPAAQLDVGHEVSSTAVIPGATAFTGCPPYAAFGIGCMTGTVPVGSSQVSTLADTPDLFGDGTSFYIARFGATGAIDRGTSVADPAALVRIATVPKLPPVTWQVDLGASRAGYVDTDGEQQVPGQPATAEDMLHWRYAAKTGSATVTLGAAHSGGTEIRDLRMGGRRQLLIRRGSGILEDSDSLWLRTEGGGADKLVFRSQPGVAVLRTGPLQLSGHRALWMRSEYSGDGCGGSCPYYDKQSAMLYDVRTGTSVRLGDATTTRWALWGPYVVWAVKDGSIYRRDLTTGKVFTVKSRGYGVIGLDVWGSYVGWSECVERCFLGNVAYRNHVTGSAPVRVATPVVALEVHMTGGHLVYGIGAGPARGPMTMRELRLGSTATATIAQYRGPALLNGPDLQHFDAYDETLAWIGLDGSARIAPNSAYTDRPKYLGNALGAAGFTPATQVWAPEFPVSKALPRCQVTIRSRLTGSVLKRLNCATSTGSARVVWNGRLDSGRLVPKGTYGWTLTGSDADGPLVWWNGATHPISGLVTVR
jgi:hypothetical protein